MNADNFQEHVLNDHNEFRDMFATIGERLRELEAGQRLCPVKASIRWIKGWLAALTLGILGVGTKLLVGFLLGGK